MTTRPRGPLPDWEPSTKRQRAVLTDVLEQYQRLDGDALLPRSGRGVFYDLRPEGHGHGVVYRKGKPDAMTATPEVVQEVLGLSRRAGIIPEEWVADDRAPNPLTPFAYENVDAAADDIENLAKNIALDRQDGQNLRVEVWCEAAGLGPRLATIAEPYGVPVYPAGGYAGLKAKRLAARRIAEREVPTVVFQVGDYDNHGRWIFRAEAEDVAHWAGSMLGGALVTTLAESVRLRVGSEERLTVVRLAVTEAQVAAGLVAVDSDGKAEAEAVPPAEMTSIVTAALDATLDPACRSRVLEQESDAPNQLRQLIVERWAR